MPSIGAFLVNVNLPNLCPIIFAMAEFYQHRRCMSNTFLAIYCSTGRVDWGGHVARLCDVVPKAITGSTSVSQVAKLGPHTNALVAHRRHCTPLNTPAGKEKVRNRLVNHSEAACTLPPRLLARLVLTTRHYPDAALQLSHRIVAGQSLCA